jgi:hypothetical protein
MEALIAFHSLEILLTKHIYFQASNGKFPSLQKLQPEVVRLSPFQAAGKLHNLDKISALSVSSFRYCSFAQL